MRILIPLITLVLAGCPSYGSMPDEELNRIVNDYIIMMHGGPQYSSNGVALNRSAELLNPKSLPLYRLRKWNSSDGRERWGQVMEVDLSNRIVHFQTGGRAYRVPVHRFAPDDIRFIFRQLTAERNIVSERERLASIVRLTHSPRYTTSHIEREAARQTTRETKEQRERERAAGDMEAEIRDIRRRQEEIEQRERVWGGVEETLRRDLEAEVYRTR